MPATASCLLYVYLYLCLNHFLVTVVITLYLKEEMDAQQSFLTHDYDVHSKQNRQAGSWLSQASLWSYLCGVREEVGGASAQRPKEGVRHLSLWLSVGDWQAPGTPQNRGSSAGSGNQGSRLCHSCLCLCNTESSLQPGILSYNLKDLKILFFFL